MYYQDGAIVDGNTISNMGNPTFQYAYYTMNSNNIFYSEADFAFESFSATPIADMDYNAFFTPALSHFRVGIYTDLTDWQTNNPNSYGQNSQEGLPQFVSPTDLHLDGVFLNDMGTYVGVNTDIDGDTRPAAWQTSIFQLQQHNLSFGQVCLMVLLMKDKKYLIQLV